MKREEKEKALKALERQERQYKRQNEYIKQNYYRTTITVPKEYAKLIKQTGESANGLLNRLLKDELVRRGLLPGQTLEE